MKRVITVSKDLGGTKPVALIAQILSDGGNEIFPIIEGLGASRWTSMCQVEPVFRGTDDYRTAYFSLDAEAMLKHYGPDVVVVGEGAPNNLEGQFARAAQKLDIQLILVEDFWGGFIRISGLTKSPDLVVTLDEYAKQLIQAHFPETCVVVSGNPGVRMDIDPAPQVMELRTDGDLIITFCGGGAETGEQLQLLCQCLSMTSGSWRLIPCWHPKVADRFDPENGDRPYRKTWDALLEPLGDRVVYFDELPTDSVVVASDLVVAGFSTLLTTAAYAGVATAALITPEVQRVLKEESRLSEVPQVALGVASHIISPIDLSLLQPCPEQERARLMPFDPVIAAEAINALIEGS